MAVTEAICVSKNNFIITPPTILSAGPENTAIVGCVDCSDPEYKLSLLWQYYLYSSCLSCLPLLDILQSIPPCVVRQLRL